jgi:periplasmic protein TonB
MRTRLNPRKNIEGRKSVFFSSGILIALSLTLLAFEWGKTGYGISLTDAMGINVPLFDEEIINTKQEKSEPKKVPSFKFIIVPDIEGPDIPMVLFDIEGRAGDSVPVYIPPKQPDEPEDPDPVSINNLNAEDWPSFPGGDEALALFMASNLKYPLLAVENRISGTVWIGFTVAKDGSITNIHVKKDVGGGCGEEAIRVVAMMPKWNPGMQRFRPVAVKMLMPVNFRLALQ